MVLYSSVRYARDLNTFFNHCTENQNCNSIYSFHVSNYRMLNQTCMSEILPSHLAIPSIYPQPFLVLIWCQKYRLFIFSSMEWLIIQLSLLRIPKLSLLIAHLFYGKVRFIIKANLIPKWHAETWVRSQGMG